MTPNDLSRCTGARADLALKFLGPILQAMDEFDINTSVRKAAFLAQIGHESGGFRFTRELWGPTQTQIRYEGRKDLGNTEPGDGFKYRGRGLIQITGRSNYMQVSAGLMEDFVANPEALESTDNAARSAAWWWKKHGCNEIADTGDFIALTKRINGGLNGYAEREALWTAAKEVFV